MRNCRFFDIFSKQSRWVASFPPIPNNQADIKDEEELNYPRDGATQDLPGTKFVSNCKSNQMSVEIYPLDRVRNPNALCIAPLQAYETEEKQYLSNYRSNNRLRQYSQLFSRAHLFYFIPPLVSPARRAAAGRGL